MNDPATLSKDDLLELLECKDDRLQQQDAELQTKDAELQTKDAELQTKDAELQTKDAELQTKDAELQAKTDIIGQLEQKNKELEAAYTKLWQERFGHRSERYLADPDQLRLDFGDTDDAADAAAGLSEAAEEANLIPAHTRVARFASRPLIRKMPRIGWLGTRSCTTSRTVAE